MADCRSKPGKADEHKRLQLVVEVHCKSEQIGQLACKFPFDLLTSNLPKLG